MAEGALFNQSRAAAAAPPIRPWGGGRDRAHARWCWRARPASEDRGLDPPAACNRMCGWLAIWRHIDAICQITPVQSPVYNCL
jgi:hypothetical protein